MHIMVILGALIIILLLMELVTNPILIILITAIHGAMLPFGHRIYIMSDRTCTSCNRLISEHILCSYDKVSLYCPGGPGPSKEEELKNIKKLLDVFEKLGI